MYTCPGFVINWSFWCFQGCVGPPSVCCKLLQCCC